MILFNKVRILSRSQGKRVTPLGSDVIYLIFLVRYNQLNINKIRTTIAIAKDDALSSSTISHYIYDYHHNRFASKPSAISDDENHNNQNPKMQA